MRGIGKGVVDNVRMSGEVVSSLSLWIWSHPVCGGTFEKDALSFFVFEI